MSEALRMGELSEEAIACVDAGRPKQVKMGPQKTKAADAAATTDGSVREAEPVQEGSTRLVERPARDKSPDPTPVLGLVSLTFRLPAQLPSGLIRASADRSIKREKPWS